MHLFPVWALVFAAAVAPASDLATPVTYTTVAKSARQVAEELSGLTHVPLETTPATAGEVLVLRVNDVPLKDLMAQIATVASAAWVKKDDVYRLVRSSERDAEEKRRETQRYTDLLKKAVDKTSKRIAGQQAYDETSVGAYIERIRNFEDRTRAGAWTQQTVNEQTALQQDSPGGRLLDRLCAALDVQAIAALSDNERLVFSTSPNRMQLPFARAGQTAWRKFLADWDVFAAGVGKSKFDEIQRINPFGNFVDQVRLSLPDHLQPAKAILAVNWTGYRKSLALRLSVATASGWIVSQITANLAVDDEWSMLPSLVHGTKPATEAFPDSGVSFSSAAQAWAADAIAKSANFGGAQSASVAEALRTWLLNPEQSDPLSLQPSEFLLALAQTGNRNLVADLPDDAIIAGIASAFGAQPKVTDPLELYRKCAGVTFTNDGSWLRVAPASPARARRARLDRHALGVLFRALDAGGSLTVDDMAAFAQANTAEAAQSIALIGFSLECSDPQQLSALSTFYSLLRFYGELDNGRRLRLAHGDTLQIASLTSEQKAPIGSVVFGVPGPMAYQNDLVYTADDLPRHRPVFGYLYAEPTEALPGGLPSDGMVAIHLSSEDVALPAERGAHGAITRNAFAMDFLYGERPDLFPASLRINSAGFWLGTSSSWDFVFQLTAKLAKKQHLQTLKCDKESPPVPYSALPEAFRDEVQKLLAQLREMYKDVKPGDTQSPGPGKP